MAATTIPSSKPTNYTQGYHDSVTRSHATRTAYTDAAFLLPHLLPHHKVLDIGCGPGTITTDFAVHVPTGSVTGVDVGSEVIEQARALSSEKQGVENVKFEVGDVLSGLTYEDGSFDVVFCNQTLTHIPDPVKALKEMKRVCARDGIVASREADMPYRWYPFLEGLRLHDKYTYKMLFGPTSSAYPQNPPHDKGYRGGSLLHVWAREAGFDPKKIEKSVSAVCYATEEQRRFWADVFVGRVEKSDVRKKFVEAGASEQELDSIVKDWRNWAEDCDGWFAILQCEIVCRQ